MALIFVPLLAATCLYASFFWWYASHVFVVVVEETAVGNDSAVWSDEPIHDWLWQGLYFGYMVAVWVVPASLLARLLVPHVAEAWRPYLFASMVFFVYWVGFPITLLSSMSAESRWAIFHPGLFQRLSKQFGHLLIFYALSAIVIAVCIPLGPWMFAGNSEAAIVIGGVLLSLAFLLYARLMGRLAHIARLTHVRPRKEKKPRPKRFKKKGVVVTDPWELPDDVQAEMDATGRGFIQPEDLPPLQTPFEGDVTGYNVAFADVPKPAETRPRANPPLSPVRGGEGMGVRGREALTDLEESMPVAAADKRAEELDTDARRRRLADITPDKVEMERGQRKAEEMPQRPWGQGIWLFPFSFGTTTHWVFLGGGLMLLGVLVHALRATWPW